MQHRPPLVTQTPNTQAHTVSTVAASSGAGGGVATTTATRKILHARTAAATHANVSTATPVSFAGLGSEVTVTLTRSGKSTAGHIQTTTTTVLDPLDLQDQDEYQQQQHQQIVIEHHSGNGQSQQQQTHEEELLEYEDEEEVEEHHLQQLQEVQDQQECDGEQVEEVYLN
ncbi:AT-rich binding protein [Ceratitis capitata]|uniref:AT-rich binding protein n=1 Tax=Ceratitis capitata TaxID=7213 RepID=UPI000A10D714|nr:AT-rich binding protein [Ceratitis capitata]